MDAELVLWLASAAAAAIFLAAGLLLGRAGRARAIATAEKNRLERTLEGEESRESQRLGAARADNERMQAELVRTNAECRRLTGETTRLQAELVARQTALEEAQRELGGAWRERETARTEAGVAEQQVRELRDQLAAAQRELTATRDRTRELSRSVSDERTRLEAVADKHRAAEAAAREALARAEDQRAELEQKVRKAEQLSAELEAIKIERVRWLERERQLEQERQSSTSDQEVEKTLRHDLVVARETGRQLDEKTKRLESDNGSLRAQLELLATRVAELSALERENAELRVRAMAGDLAMSRRSSSDSGPIAVGGHLFQALVERVGGLDPVRSAVIADDMGLVVASHGTHGEELAAIGALFARSGSEARKMLPLDHLHRVIVEDERNISVTVRPLRATDGVASDGELTLVTLAVGAEPDPGLVARILHGENGTSAAAQVES